MVAHGHEQVKEQFAAHLHLQLHGTATLESVSAANNKSEVMSAEARVSVRGVLVGVPGAAQDDADLDSALKALLAQRQLLELLEAVALSGTVHGRVTEDNVAHTGKEDGRLDTAATTKFRALHGRTLEVPRVALLVVQEAWVVVSLVEVLEDTGEDCRFFVRERKTSRRVEELTAQGRSKVRRLTQYVLVCRKQSLVLTHHKSDDGAGEGRGRAAEERISRCSLAIRDMKKMTSKWGSHTSSPWNC